MLRCFEIEKEHGKINLYIFTGSGFIVTWLLFGDYIMFINRMKILNDADNTLDTLVRKL